MTVTKTADRTESRIAGPAESRGEIAVFQPPRLPYHDAIKERFGIDRGAWKVLTEAIFPSAKSPDAIVMALSYCRSRNLDIFKRPVHIVPMWSSAAGGMVETVWPGIAELRTTAFRTGNYAGCDEAVFGPLIEQTFTGKIKQKDGWKDKSVIVKFPEWCRITIYRQLGGKVCKFVGPKVLWLESYATIGKSVIPNDMWESRPEGQLEKCAEAAALRRAFPEEIGNELTAEEMAGRTIDDDRVTHVAPATIGTDAGPPDPDAAVVEPPKDEVIWNEDSEDPVPPEPNPTREAKATEPRTEQVGTHPLDIPPELDRRKPAAADVFDSKGWVRDATGALTGCESMVELGEIKTKVLLPAKGKAFPPDWKAVSEVYKQTFDRLSGDNILDGG